MKSQLVKQVKSVYSQISFDSGIACVGNTRELLLTTICCELSARYGLPLNIDSNTIREKEEIYKCFVSKLAR